MNLLAEAVAWHQAGYTPVPVAPDGTKRPAIAWRDWQTTRPDAGTIIDTFARIDSDGIGLLCGATSGHLEMLELEGRAVEEGYLDRLAQAFADNGLTELWTRVETGYCEQTPSGGLHWYYRVDGPAARNTKLARRPATAAELERSPERTKVLIETRGEGGFTVIAPSAGRTHKTGAAWTVLAGGRDTIPLLTVAERDALFDIANLLDEMPAVEWTSPGADTPATPRSADDLRPGDDYNTRATWADILGPRGWTLAHRWASGRLGWARPGKHPRDGISATTGGARDGVDRLYVFSSSTEFEQEKPYTKFSAITLLEHGGDFGAATRALRAAGYGTQAPPAPEPGPALTLLPGGRQDPPAIDGTAALQLDTSDDPPPLPAIIATSLTDQGNADLLAARHSHRLRWVPARSQWLAWDGKRWKPCDDHGEARQAAIDTVRAIPPNDDNTRAHKLKSLSRRSLDAMVDLATSHPKMRTAAEDLDADPWALNTPGGLIDLRTGAVRPSTPEDRCTRITRHAAALGAPAPRWATFLDDTFGGDTEMVGYVQRLAGYSALGIVTHHVLPFLHGPGGNGKSVFTDVIVEILGDYASTTPPAFLLAGRDDESAIARLAGLRLVASSEVNQGSRWDEAKVKLLTGGDQLTARFLYGRHFTFHPTHTLWIAGNHQPRVEAGGQSFWRRLRMIPFTQTIPEEKRIENLKELLLDEEGPAILGWIVAGAIDVLADGLREPAEVKDATREYADQEDHLGRFVDERLMLSGSGREKASELRAAYANWCKAEGETPASNQILVRELKARWSIQTVKSHGVRYYTGAMLFSDPQNESSDPRDIPWDQR